MIKDEGITGWVFYLLVEWISNHDRDKVRSMLCGIFHKAMVVKSNYSNQK